MKESFVPEKNNVFAPTFWDIDENHSLGKLIDYQCDIAVATPMSMS